MKALMTTICAAGLLLVGVSAPARAQRAHIGPHVAYNFDLDRAAVGAHMLLPLGSEMEFYPSFDYYLVDRGTRVGLSGDLKYRVPTGGGSAFYVGGGLDFQTASASGTSNHDTGWDVLFGLESRRGSTHPFIEGRVLGHDNTAFQLGAG